MISKVGIFTRVYAGVKVDASKIHRRDPLGANRAKSCRQSCSFPTMDRRNEGERLGGRFGKKSAEIYADELARDDREIEFPRKEFLLSPSLLLSWRVHLFRSREGCASTYAIEMKFLINK